MEKEQKEIKQVSGRMIAIAKGFDGMAVRDIGDVFNYKGPQGSWFKAQSDKDAAHNDVGADNYGQVHPDHAEHEVEEKHKLKKK